MESILRPTSGFEWRHFRCTYCLRPDHEIDSKGSKHQDRAQERAQSADTGPPSITHTEPAKNLDTLACEDEVNQGRAPARRQHAHHLAHHLLALLQGIDFVNDEVRNHNVECSVRKSPPAEVSIVMSFDLILPFLRPIENLRTLTRQ